MSTSTQRVKPVAADIVWGRSIKNNIAWSFQPSCWNVDRVLCELPDRDERAQNQAWIHYELERIATFFFGANQKGVSGLLVVQRLISRVRLFIHDTNFTRQVLAAMTIIIKFLPHHIAAGDRVAIASEGAKEGARVIVNGAMEQINRDMRKRCWALLSTRLNNQTKYVHSSDYSS